MSGKLYNKFWHGNACMLRHHALCHRLSMTREQVLVNPGPSCDLYVVATRRSWWGGKS